MVIAALGSGRAHIAGREGQEPNNPKAWGWRDKENSNDGESGGPIGDSWSAQGAPHWLVGWEFTLFRA